jgi:predicted nucleic acid-binding protein
MLTASGDLPGPLLVPATIVAEVCYMISRYNFGSAAEAAFLRSFADSDLIVTNIVDDDSERMAQLVEQYADFPLGGSDAGVIAIAERRSITTILTTDRRHFGAVRPKHIEAFDLLP